MADVGVNVFRANRVEIQKRLIVPDEGRPAYFVATVTVKTSKGEVFSLNLFGQDGEVPIDVVLT